LHGKEKVGALLIRGCFAIGLLLAAGNSAPAQNITAGEAIQRIERRYIPALPQNTVDTIKAGDASTRVTGIVTTFLDTMDVLREANRLGANLVITHEPTFYNHLDDTSFFANDPVYREKLEYVQQHHMVVFRLHDGIHSASPDPVATALIQQLGWKGYTTSTNPFLLTIPQTSLLQLSRDLATKLEARTLRVVGDPDLQVTHLGLVPGAAGLQMQVLALRRDDVEVLLVGESAEWEAIEYVRDAVAQGRHKALILLGHEVSEEAGMKQCAEDLRPLFPGLKITHVSAQQPLWLPTNPPANKSSTKPSE
jgi:putative NIF3 family GTP cyclohydrolase 1 type 2